MQMDDAELEEFLSSTQATYKDCTNTASPMQDHSVPSLRESLPKLSQMIINDCHERSPTSTPRCVANKPKWEFLKNTNVDQLTQGAEKVFTDAVLDASVTTVTDLLPSLQDIRTAGWDGPKAGLYILHWQDESGRTSSYTGRSRDLKRRIGAHISCIKQVQEAFAAKRSFDDLKGSHIQQVHKVLGVPGTRHFDQSHWQYRRTYPHDLR